MTLPPSREVVEALDDRELRHLQTFAKEQIRRALRQHDHIGRRAWGDVLVLAADRSAGRTS
jgi:hypothetical protein